MVVNILRLKLFDEYALASQKDSHAPTPPQSVTGIGNKRIFHSTHLSGSEPCGTPAAKLKYSESKIVVAMVRWCQAPMAVSQMREPRSASQLVANHP